MPVPAGSPPWIIKFGITRWKMVPSYRRSLLLLRVTGCVHSRLPSASSRKFATVFGASLSKRRQTICPSVVSNVAYSPGWRAIDESSFVRKLFFRCGRFFVRCTARFRGGFHWGLTAHDGDLVDPHRVEWTITCTWTLIPRRARDLLHQRHGRGIALPKDRVSPIKARLRSLCNKELRSIRVGQSGVRISQTPRTVEQQSRRDLEAEGKSDLAGAGARRISALDHELRDDAMKDSAVVERRTLHAFAAGRALPLLRAFRQSNKVGHTLRSLLVEELAGHLAGCGVDYGCGAGRNGTTGLHGRLLCLRIRRRQGKKNS